MTPDQSLTDIFKNDPEKADLILDKVLGEVNKGNATPWHATSESAAAPNDTHARELQPRKSFITAAALSSVFGLFGADRFYLGHYKTGALKLVTIGGLTIWWLVDIYLVISGRLVDSKGAPLKGREQNKTIVAIASVAWVIFYVYVISSGNEG